MSLRRLKHLFWVIPVAFLLLCAAYFLHNLLNDNFHTVIPGRLYRSAQLQPDKLRAYVGQYGIRSIINLRGPHPQEKWYVGERSVSRQDHLQQYNVILPAHGLATHQELLRLARILQVAAQPILVHCRQGADRTGLTSAMAVILSGDEVRRHATRQMTWRYNVLSPSTVGYQVMTNYFHWLQRQHANYGKASFLRWLHSHADLRPHHGAFLP